MAVRMIVKIVRLWQRRHMMGYIHRRDETNGTPYFFGHERKERQQHSERSVVFDLLLTSIFGLV
ncbi:MAG: hypothetical protein CMJ64_29520 [Planctomycetaceae bacterium]|nr:hypothetical protein [Planctomycetaceae bacterium]